MAEGKVTMSFRMLKTVPVSGSEQTSRVFKKVVHFFCNVFWPPRSPWRRREHSVGRRE